MNETVESGADLAKELTITNNGSEPLTYSIVPGDFTSVYDPSMVNAKVSYLYSASVDDNNVKYEWVDIENGIGDRNGFSYYNTHDYLEVNLPFAFPFYGKEYTTMYIYNTGFVSFTERNDDKIWPEPPADFPTGSVYTNILAPYWGLHTMDTNTTAGTYHYITEDQAVISWMEYGNSMNLGVCFQLIMKKDGSFKFQYKGKDQNSIIYSTFGLAGACNEGGSEYFVIPDRYIQFGNAVQFSPVAEATIEPSQSKSVTLNIDTHKMAGNYTDAVTVNTNVPGSETVTVPVTLTVTGAAEPVFPTDITIEHVAGYQEQVTETSGPGVMYAGAPYEIPFSIENTGTAVMTVLDIAYDSPTDDLDSPLFNLMAQLEVEDYISGEKTLQWTMYEYYRGMPIEVTPDKPLLMTMPMSWDCYATIGEYSIPVTVTYTLDGVEELTKSFTLKFNVTDVPEMWLDRNDISVENAEPTYKGTETLVISNEGNYKLTYSLRLDPTGEGEQISEGEGGGVAPLSAKATLTQEQLAQLQGNINTEVKPFSTPRDVLDAPVNFEYNNILFHPSTDNLTYGYGAGNTYAKYVAATHFVAPEGGFNISHIYLAATLTNNDGSSVSNVDINVEIVAGSDYENGNVIGKGTFHFGAPITAQGLVVPLDRAVYLNEGQEFYVRVHYPVGVQYPAYLVYKEEPVIDNRYMGFVEGYGWFDVAAMFKNQYGSLGYILSCLETVPGSPWVKMLNTETTGEIAPSESLDVKFELNAASAPLEVGNKAVLVIKSNDPSVPVVNFPITLDRNRMPVITVPGEAIVVSEGTKPTVQVTVTEPEADDFTIVFTDNAGISSITSIDVDGEGSYEDLGEEGIKVKGANKATLNVTISPDYETAGNYSFTVFAADAFNQEASATVEYTVEHANRAPVATEIPDVQIAVDNTSSVINFADYFTDPDGDAITYTFSCSEQGIASAYASGNNVIFYGEAEGSIVVTVTATDALGAKTTITFNVVVSGSSALDDVSVNNNVTIYPNPVVESLNVRSNVTGEAVYGIYTLNGGNVYSANHQGGLVTINVAHLAEGIYILRITADGEVANIPFIKK